MFLDDLLLEKNISLYKLAQITNIPYSTLSDIRLNKSDINNCSFRIVKQIASAFDLSIDELIDYSEPFELYRCNLLHLLKSMKEEEFLYNILSDRRIDYFYKIKSYSKCLYLLALTDYLCEKNNIEIISNYSNLRKLKLKNLLMSNDLILLKQNLSQEKFDRIINNAMPEFLKYNIVEDNIYDVY